VTELSPEVAGLIFFLLLGGRAWGRTWRGSTLPHPATDLRAVYRQPDAGEVAHLAAMRERRPDLRDIAAATRGGREGVRALLDSYPPGPAGEPQPPG
jgi:hypothetical protein